MLGLRLVLNLPLTLLWLRYTLPPHLSKFTKEHYEAALPVVVCAAVSLFAAISVSAQDAAKVDLKHYKVEAENAQVRVIRIHYGPHEKSVMHSHPASVVVYLTDGKVRMHLPGGKTQDAEMKKGQTALLPATVHEPENLGDTPFELIQIELKSPKGAGTKKEAMKQ